MTAPSRPNAAADRNAPTNNLWFGALFVVVGLAIMAMMILSPEGLNAPMWVGLAAASTFVFAGASVVAQSLGFAGLGKWIGVFVVFLLTVPGFWIMLGSGEMSCSRSISFLASGAGGDLEYRVVFGAGAIVVLAMAVTFAWAAWRGRAS